MNHVPMCDVVIHIYRIQTTSCRIIGAEQLRMHLRVITSHIDIYLARRLDRIYDMCKRSRALISPKREEAHQGFLPRLSIQAFYQPHQKERGGGLLIVGGALALEPGDASISGEMYPDG